MPNIRRICPELAIKARVELHEVESRIPEDIAALREWISKQPHLTARTDDQFLVTFLRGSKYSLEKAKSKIDHYYTIRSLTPELFLYKSVDDKALRLTRLGPFVPLPKPLKADGPRIQVTRYGQINPDEFSMMDLFHQQMRVFEIQLHDDDHGVIAGLTNIADMSNMSLKFILYFDHTLSQKFMIFMEKALPFRIKNFHIVNAPKEFATVINIMKGIMPKKMRERMFIHSSFETLYEHIPKEYLPEEYGGNNGRLQDSIDQLEKRMLGYQEFFEDDKKYGVDEKLRIGEKITTESLFGMDGSFRKLEVD